MLLLNSTPHSMGSQSPQSLRGALRGSNSCDHPVLFFRVALFDSRYVSAETIQVGYMRDDHLHDEVLLFAL